ncbi:MAG: hypothetical protein WAW75_04445 [Gallionella sp.]
MNDDKNLSISHGTPAPSVKVHYWFGDGDLEGVEEFRSELSASYSIAEVKGGQGELGGGLYTLFIEIASSIALPNFLQLIVDGVAFDLIKLGAHNLVLRPLLAAHKKLRTRNHRGDDADIAELKLLFNDSVVTIDAANRVHQKIADSIGELLTLLARHYKHLALATGERPIHIYIPVIEDTGEDPVSRFRAVLEVDEEMRISNKVFFEYWGLKYSKGAVRVYDVANKLLIDEAFISREFYWDRMQDRWKQGGNT